MLSELSRQANEIVIKPEFNLFSSENLIHISRLSKVEKILKEGLYSLSAMARQEGKTVHPGIWFPNDNLVVKFLKFEEPTQHENFISLNVHITRFGKFESDDHAVGFIVRSNKAKRLSEIEPYFCIDDHVPPQDIHGIVLPLLPMLRKDVNHFASEINRKAAQKVINAVNNAHCQKTIPANFELVDHFGRQLPFQ